MSNLDEMWQELARYQTYADKRGFGAEWRTMCEERTEKAARAATEAARFVETAWAAEASTLRILISISLSAASAAGAVDRWSQITINDIREAIEQEESIEK